MRRRWRDAVLWGLCAAAWGGVLWMGGELLCGCATPPPPAGYEQDTTPGDDGEDDVGVGTEDTR